MKKLFSLIIAILLLPLCVNAVMIDVNIDKYSYDETNKVLSINGTVEQVDEVVVSIYEKDTNKLMAFKTVTAENNVFEATFKFTVDKDTKIIIKASSAEEGSANDITGNTDDIIIPKTDNPRIIYDDDGNSLKYLNANKTFPYGSKLWFMFATTEEFDDALNEEKDASQARLQEGETVVGLMEVNAVNSNDDPVTIDSPGDEGFALNLMLSEDDLKAIGTNLKLVKYEGLGEADYENPIDVEYDPERGSVYIEIPDSGMYLLYSAKEEMQEENKTENTTKNTNQSDTGDYIAKYIVIGIACAVSLSGAVIILKKKTDK